MVCMIALLFMLLELQHPDLVFCNVLCIHFSLHNNTSGHENQKATTCRISSLYNGRFVSFSFFITIIPFNLDFCYLANTSNVPSTKIQKWSRKKAKFLKSLVLNRSEQTSLAILLFYRRGLLWWNQPDKD